MMFDNMLPIMQIVEKNCKYNFDDIEQIPTMCIILLFNLEL